MDDEDGLVFTLEPKDYDKWVQGRVFCVEVAPECFIHLESDETETNYIYL